MEGELSYVGPGIVRRDRRVTARRHLASSRRMPILAAILIATLLLSVLAFFATAPESELAARPLAVTTIPIVIQYQHRDTNMPCVANPPDNPVGPHLWNHASGPDLIYGTGDDCPHCSAYCAPASIAMIATYRIGVMPFTLQDQIYDNGKQVLPELPGDGIIQTHGEGMFDGTGVRPFEVQMSMTWALGVPITQHDWVGGNPKGPMTPGLLQGYIGGQTPVLWLDHGGWPQNQSAMYPPTTNRTDQGHAKVIGGYDDNNTPADTTDDLCLIYDPWPEYFQKSFLPVNCTPGPGPSWDPYWQPLNDINLTDAQDIYLVDTFPVIPEFTTVVLPVIGTIMIAAVVLRRRK